MPVSDKAFTDGTGTQGQAGYAHAVLRGIVPQPRQKPKGRPGHSPGGWFTASGCESKDRQGDTASVTFSLIYGAYGRLYGGNVAGRLTKDPAVYNNNDGSRKIRFTVAAQDHFTDGDGNRGSQFIPLEAFIPARQQGNGP